MAISSSNSHNKSPRHKKNPLSPQKNQASPLPSPLECPKSPDAHNVGGRIVDSENSGRTCHQCRQKTMNFLASCKNPEKKSCTSKFCRKCLLNRYGEKVEEVEQLGDWKCPKCRGVCNCSICMKKKGQRPTGILVHAAKATGFSSVMEMLHLKGTDELEIEKILNARCTSLNKPTISTKESVAPKRKHEKENSLIEDSNVQCKPIAIHNDDTKIETMKTVSKKLRLDKGNGNESKGSDKDDGLQKKESQTHISEKVTYDTMKKEKKVDDVSNDKNNKDAEGSYAQVLKFHKLNKPKKNDNAVTVGGNADVLKLPKGTDLVNVAGVELSADDVGPALQFLEFCSAFQQVLDLKKGQAESVLRELTRGRVARRGLYSSIIQFQIKLLSLIQKDIGEVSLLSDSTNTGSLWLEVLGKCISESQFAPKEVPLEYLIRGADGYDKLGCSEKLRVINFLCDEVLGTNDMRNYIDEQQAKYIESKREAKDKIQAAKEKKELMNQKLKDEVAHVILSSKENPQLPISKHDDLISKIMTEKKRAHAEVLEAMEMASEKERRMDAVRSEPLLLDGTGRAYWKLRSHSDKPCILLQDIENWDLITPHDKWCVYYDEQEKAVHKYISSFREKNRRRLNTCIVKS